MLDEPLLFRPRPVPPVTPSGAWRFTLAEVLAMREAEILDPDVRFELLDGELLPVPDEGDLHIDGVAVLYRWLQKALGGDYEVHMRAPISLASDTQLAPDLIVWPNGLRAADMNQENALLVIEISDTTLSSDLGRKAARYARAGVRELWIVDVNARRLWAHRRPLGDEWAEKRAVSGDESLSPLFAPETALSMDQLHF